MPYSQNCNDNEVPTVQDEHSCKPKWFYNIYLKHIHHFIGWDKEFMKTL